MMPPSLLEPFSPRVQEGADGLVIRFTGGSLALTQDNAFVLDGLLRRAAAEAGGRDLVLDFSNVTVVSSAGLGVLVGLHNRLRAAGGRLVLRDLDNAVYEVFEATHLTLLFDVRRAAPAGGPGQSPPGLLVVDDDESVRHLLDRALRRRGFRVVSAATGGDGVACCRQDPGGIGAALLDVHMPGMSGPETLAALRTIVPGMRCCFMTGDPRPYTEEDLLALGAARVFWKPFAVGEVVEVLRGLIGSAVPCE
jgi:anti-anti-sigma factor